MNNNLRVCVVMAGGAGERFWPLSRRQHPKQLLKLTGSGQSMLEDSASIISPMIPRDRVYVATARALRDVIAASGVVPEGNVLAEPCKRNTAGCLTYAAAEILARYGEEASSVTMAVLTADHLIGHPEQFLDTVSAILDLVEREPVLGIIGIRPTRPETGYGYIEVAAGAAPATVSCAGVELYPVERFREKPDPQTAAAFVETGRFFWNSGMFFWRLGTFLEELELASPLHAQAARAMAAALQSGDLDRVEALFAALPDISIDFALMEKARRVVVARGGFAWDDVGSWDALDRTQPHDSEGNVVLGDPVLVDTQRCVVYNAPGADKMAVAVVGVEDLAIIVSADGVLVMPKDRAQDLRKAVDVLKKRNAPQL